MKRAFVAMACAFAVGPAFAYIVPGPCGHEEHVQCAVYDANEVYGVATVPGMAILLQLEAGEAIEDSGAGMGDGKAWNVSANKNWILLKRAGKQPDTNLMVVTNRRSYVFDLTTAKQGTPATWVLRFGYPDTRAGASEDHGQGEAAQHVGVPVAVVPNRAYSMQGDMELAPTSVWDDSTFTYLRYATARDLPRIYVKRVDGTEALLAYHMDGDTIVAHETAREFVARLGSAVLSIRNDGYSPEGHYNAFGTTIPGMVRLFREH